ncbi:ABC transporter [Helicobacter pylori]|nr:ABC transporter [Helicobacter pylori]NHA94538.1 ABC transporter [Helicobacter pylori]NHA94627.1 ABC transporter [Helicobacter pylori]NHA95568.1 ABC transporter [Helicobacter pylori]
MKSHKLAQHPTTYKYHRYSDLIVLDSCEWVLLLKNGNIAQYKPLNSILKSVAKTFNFKEKPTTKDLLALLKDI